MARAKKFNSELPSQPVQPYKPSDKADWYGFINIRLDEKATQGYVDLSAEHVAYLDDQLEQALISGYKLSVVMDVDNDCYIATLTGRIAPHIDSRASMSARASTVIESQRLLMYKHIVVAKSDWGAYSPKTGKMNFG